MKRASPMRRTAFKAKPKAKKRRDSGTRSKVSKKPWKSAWHIARVKAEICLLMREQVQPLCGGPMDAHHCRKLLPDRLLPRHDSLAIPLCRNHHKLMDGNERAFWKWVRIDPADWIADFSEAGRKAIEELKNA